MGGRGRGMEWNGITIGRHELYERGGGGGGSEVKRHCGQEVMRGRAGGGWKR